MTACKARWTAVALKRDENLEWECYQGEIGKTEHSISSEHAEPCSNRAITLTFHMFWSVTGMAFTVNGCSNSALTVNGCKI